MQFKKETQLFVSKDIQVYKVTIPYLKSKCMNLVDYSMKKGAKFNKMTKQIYILTI